MYTIANGMPHFKPRLPCPKVEFVGLEAGTGLGRRVGERQAPSQGISRDSSTNCTCANCRAERCIAAGRQNCSAVQFISSAAGRTDGEGRTRRALGPALPSLPCRPLPYRQLSSPSHPSPGIKCDLLARLPPSSLLVSAPHPHHPHPLSALSHTLTSSSSSTYSILYTCAGHPSGLMTPAPCVCPSHSLDSIHLPPSPPPTPPPTPPPLTSRGE